MDNVQCFYLSKMQVREPTNACLAVFFCSIVCYDNKHYGINRNVVFSMQTKQLICYFQYKSSSALFRFVGAAFRQVNRFLLKKVNVGPKI